MIGVEAGLVGALRYHRTPPVRLGDLGDSLDSMHQVWNQQEMDTDDYRAVRPHTYFQLVNYISHESIYIYMDNNSSYTKKGSTGLKRKNIIFWTDW